MGGRVEWKWGGGECVCGRMMYWKSKVFLVLFCFFQSDIVKSERVLRFVVDRMSMPTVRRKPTFTKFRNFSRPKK